MLRAGRYLASILFVIPWPNKFCPESTNSRFTVSVYFNVGWINRAELHLNYILKINIVPLALNITMHDKLNLSGYVKESSWVYIYISIQNLFIWNAELWIWVEEGVGERNLPPASTFPKRPQWLGLGQAKPIQDPSAAFPGAVTVSWITSRAPGPSYGILICKQQFNLLYHKVET